VDGTQRRARLARSRLYLVLEARPHDADPTPLLDAALRGGVDIVQLREKDLPDDELVRAATPFRRACDAHGALFVLNDRPELAERCGADGVHVGQSDAPLLEARRAVGAERIVGLSATTPAELYREPDYFGVGAIFGTPTKTDSAPGGLELVRAARDTLRVPWFAIGGIDESTLADVVAHGAPGAAVVRAVRDTDDPEDAARSLRAVLPTSEAAVVEGEDVLLPQIDFVFGTRSPDQPAVAPHTHAAHMDAFYLLDGTLEFRLGDTTVRLPAGSCAAAPPLVVHGFRSTDGDARFLNLHTPGVWARGRAARLPREQYDTFGPDRSSSSARPFATAPSDGDRLAKPHRLALLKVQSHDADVLEYAVDAEYDGAGPHLHLRHADCFHVLEGALELRLDGKNVRAESGMSVVVPPGVEHEFTSAGNARFLNVHAPSCGFVDYLRRLDAGEDFDHAAYDSHAVR
jgi:thiamine-phosphate pyrophosphorylase